MPKMDAADALLAALLPKAEPGFPHYIFRTDKETREVSCRSTSDVLDFYAELIHARGTRGAQFNLELLFQKHGGKVAEVLGGVLFFERMTYRPDTEPFFEKCLMTVGMDMCYKGNRVINMPPNDFGFPTATLPEVFVPKYLTVYKFGDRDKLGQTSLAMLHMTTPRDMIVLHVFCADVEDTLTLCFHEGKAAKSTQRIQLAHMETLVLVGRAIREFRVSVPAHKRAGPVYLFKAVPDLSTGVKRKRDERGNDE